MIHVALYEPEIPPNTGNISRLCAANGVPLHIVGKAKFSMDDKAVKRAGLDYWPHVRLHQHPGGIDELRAALSSESRILCLTTKTTQSYTDFSFRENDCILFGPETRGLPREILEANPEHCLTIPMLTQNVRSLNLSSSAAIVLYEALRQLGCLTRTP